MMLFLSPTVPPLLEIPPPELFAPPMAELPESVLLVIVSVLPPLRMPPPRLLPPPLPPTELPESVLLVIVSVPSLPFKMPPPVLFVPPLAELPESVLLLIVRWPPSLKMPPPLLKLVPLTELPESVLLVIVRLPPSLLKMPPPWFAKPPLIFPLAIVKSEIVTGLTVLIVKIRKAGVPAAGLRTTVSRFAPGPVIVRPLSITNWADVSVMGLARPAAKVIMPPSQAWKIVSRKDPAPLSLLLVTTVGPQLIAIVAVANPPPRPPFVLFNEACTWKLPFAFELSAGVNFNPALPSAKVMKSLLLI